MGANKQFYYQLKYREYPIYKGEPPYWGRAFFKGIVEAENSKEARKIIQEQIFERELKKEDDILLSTLEITNERQYLKSFFVQKTCKWCNSSFSYANNEYYGDYCCRACYEQATFKERLEDEEDIFGDSDFHVGMPVIYRIFDRKNNKNYIGQTIRPFTLRWWEHCKNWILSLPDALITDFEFSVLEVFDKNVKKDFLTEKEQFYIQKFNALNDGYNSINAKATD